MVAHRAWLWTKSTTALRRTAIAWQAALAIRPLVVALASEVFLTMLRGLRLRCSVLRSLRLLGPLESLSLLGLLESEALRLTLQMEGLESLESKLQTKRLDSLKSTLQMERLDSLYLESAAPRWQ